MRLLLGLGGVDDEGDGIDDQGAVDDERVDGMYDDECNECEGTFKPRPRLKERASERSS